MRAQRPASVGLALALLSAITFATSGTFARSLIGAGWTAETAVAARVSIAALVLAGPAVYALRGKWAVLRRNLRPLTVFGLLAVAGAQVGFFNAVRYLPIGVALLLEYLGIILVVGWMWAMHGQRPHRLTVAGSLAALVGLVFVLDVVGGAQIDLVGVLWGLGAAIGLATYFVMSARVDAELPPVAMASAGMGIGAVVLFALGGVGALSMHATFGQVDYAGHQVSWLIPILGVSLLAAVIPYVAGIFGARILGARLASFVGLTEVLFAVLIAWLVLDELPTLGQLFGGLLIVGGVTLVRVDELRRSPKAPEAVAVPVGVGVG